MMPASLRRLYPIVCLLGLLCSAESMRPQDRQKLEHSKMELEKLEQWVNTRKTDYEREYGFVHNLASKHVGCVKAMKQADILPETQMEFLENMMMTTKGRAEKSYEDAMMFFQKTEQRIAEFKWELRMAEMMDNENGSYQAM